MSAQAGPGSVGNRMTLAVRDLRMRYGDTDVLSGVTFSAQRGEVLGLLAKDEDITDLEVRRASREDTYMALVQRAEASPSRFARQADTEQRESTGDASEAQA